MKPQVKYGLLVSVATFVVFIVSSRVSIERAALLSYMGIFILAFGIFFAIRDTREKNGGYISYGRTLGIGTLTALISGAADGAGRYIYTKFIYHDFIMTARNYYMDVIAQSKSYQYTPDQISMIKSMIPVIISPGSLSMYNLIQVIFFGFMISLLMGALLKRDNNSRQMPGI